MPRGEVRKARKMLQCVKKDRKGLEGMKRFSTFAHANPKGLG